MKKPSLISDCLYCRLYLGDWKKSPGSGCGFSNKRRQISFIKFFCISILPGGSNGLAEGEMGTIQSVKPL